MGEKKVVLVSYGSLGDLHPYLSVGTSLKARGHNVTLACSERFRDSVMNCGLCHVGLPPDLTPYEQDPSFQKRGLDPKTGAEFIIRNLFLPHLEESYRLLLDACHDADLIVSHILAYAVPLVAEKLGCPWVQIFLQPTSLFSKSDPPIIAAAPLLRQLGVGRSAVYSALYWFLRRTSRHWFRTVDELRRREGLEKMDSHPLLEPGSRFGTFGWFTQRLVSPQGDWPKSFRVVGFPAPGYQPPPILSDSAAQFLEREQPIVFTLGSTAVFQPGDFYAESAAAAKILGRPAVLLGSAEDQGGSGTFLSDTLLALKYYPYEQVFSKASAIVHHGGIGSIHQALRAGVPSLAVPFTYDQPDNAFRVASLGAGLTLRKISYNRQSAVNQLARLIGEPEFKRTAHRISVFVLKEEEANRIVTSLETLMDERK